VPILFAVSPLRAIRSAPRSTFDFTMDGGMEIPIEERSPDEIRIVADDGAFNPAFDVTPGRLITGIITEYGVLQAPYEDSIADLQTRPRILLAAR
jgi:methylthioribose-1-phosphate isomerase